MSDQIKYIAQNTDITSVANAIRLRGGTTDALSFPNEFVTAIGNIASGGVVEYVLQPEYVPYVALTAFNLTNHGLSYNDLIVDNHTFVYCVAKQTVSFLVYENMEETNYFECTIPSGTILPLVNHKDTSLEGDTILPSGRIFFSGYLGLPEYGFLNFDRLTTFTHDNVKLDLILIRNGCTTASQGYSRRNGVNGNYSIENFELHVLKY